jgi:hypothetical protein
MALDVTTIPNQMPTVKADLKCCVGRTMQKLLLRKQQPERLHVAKQRKRQKKLRSDEWRFVMATVG